MSTKAQTYTQCRLEKPWQDIGSLVDIVWIPTKYAKLNKILKIKQEDASWDDGWTVTAVYSTKKASEVESNERDYLRQRQASDI